MFFMEHVRGIKIQEAVSLWREIDQNVKNESYSSLRGKIRRAAEKGIIDTAWFSGDGYKLYKNTDVIKFAKSQMKSEPVTNCNQTEQPTSDCSQLPKLTAEVFDRPDCPEWAKYAAVDKNGKAYYFINKPKCCNAGYFRDLGWDAGNFMLIGDFDSSDWQNSLIERPAKLTEWCKVGEWVFDAAINKYVQVSEDDIIKHSTKICKYISDGEVVQARLRPWRGSESLNKVVISGGDTFGVVIGCTWSTANVSGQWINCKKLLDDDYKQPDGSPCGVLEHLENGEWVK
jgi:hypothetical protein